MLFTASFFQPFHINGELISIARTEPTGIKITDKLLFFVPSYEFQKQLISHKTTKSGLDNLILAYKRECASKLTEIKEWLAGLEPEVDQTLASWELPGEFSYRNLAFKFVEHYRPDCVGGNDRPAYNQDREGIGLFYSFQERPHSFYPLAKEPFKQDWCRLCKYNQKNPSCLEEKLKQEGGILIDTTLDQNTSCPDFLG
jgi:hypothetical protein